MRSLLFLTQKQIDWLHQKVIEEFGGTYGLRDHGLLASAVKHPQLHYHYTRCDLFEIAATYAYHIAQAQAYFDGNKRTAVATALLFLKLNDVSTEFDSLPLYKIMIGIADSSFNKNDLADLLRKLCYQK